MDTTAVIHSHTPETIAAMKNKIDDLNKNLEEANRLSRSHYDNYRNLTLQVDGFIDELGSFIRNGEIEQEIAETLAECFGRELTRKVRGSIRIEGDVEIEVPAYYDLEDIGDELDIHIGQSYTATVRVDYSDISSVEIEEF